MKKLFLAIILLATIGCTTDLVPQVVTVKTKEKTLTSARYTPNDATPHYKMWLTNVTSTKTTIEFSLMLNTDMENIFSAYQSGINLNPYILNGGTPCTNRPSTGCTSFVFIPGSESPELAAMNFTAVYNNIMIRQTGVNEVPYTFYPRASTGIVNPIFHLRLGNSLGNPATSPVIIPNKDYCLGRFRLTNTVPWANDTDSRISINKYIVGLSSSNITSHQVEDPTYSYGYSTETYDKNGVVELNVINDINNPIHLILNPCIKYSHKDGNVHVKSNCENISNILITDLTGKILFSKGFINKDEFEIENKIFNQPIRTRIVLKSGKVYFKI